MKKKNTFSIPTIFFSCFLFLLMACTTTKNTAMRRGWHNMNARYNGYFYSNEYLKEDIKKVEKANKDDFIKILPIFIYPDNQTAKNFYADFDKIIKKSSIVIQRHAIINPKTKEEIPNACKWIDENYMLIGKAHVYKRDFFSGLEMFEYVSKKYPNPEAKYGGMLWMVRANNEIGSLSKSEKTLDDLRNAKDFPKDKTFQRELALVSADYYIKKEDYPAAITLLTRAIVLTKKKPVKGRYIFILAQLYEKSGDNVKASKYYSMVPAMHPSYEMEFTAQIKQGKLFDTQSGDSKVIKKQLMRMLRDDKNSEYRDQIYYALAEIANKEKDIPLAISYLDKSIRESVSNNTQKALSYLKRAEIYFDETNYKSAEANYDSAMTFLPKDYPDYSSIESKKKSLNALVLNLNVITLEDSLQGMAKMTEKERNAAIEGMISKTEEEEKKKEEARQEQINNPTPIPQSQTNPTPEQGNGSTAWYFYNPATVTFGVGEFSKKWGSRKLEDNWRRSEKEAEVSTVDVEANEQIDSTAMKDNSTAGTKGKNNKKDKNYYLKSIPLSPDALAKSNIKIVDAYYNIGSIYKEQLLNNAKSVETIEELLKRFPNNKYKIACYYQLYRTYLAMNDIPKSDFYKNILLKDYPDSEYTKIIKNPGYAKVAMANKSQVESFYSETYQLYSEGKYNAALSKCLAADSMFYKNNLMPQFDFLKALCIGRTQDIDAFGRALTQVVIKYPKEPVKDRAQEILDLIRKQKNPVVIASDTTKNATSTVIADTAKAKQKFVFNDKGEYYWLTVVENGKGDITKFKTKLSDLNRESFSTEGLTISSVFLDISHQLITVKSFDGKTKAMDYYNFFKDNKAAFADLIEGTYQSFVISAENYIIFYKDKNISNYQQFFSENFK